MSLQRKLSYLEHTKSDSKLIWTLLLVVGYITGNLTDIVSLAYPILDDRYVTVEQLEDIKCDCQEDLPADLPAIIPVDPQTGTITPRVVPSNET